MISLKAIEVPVLIVHGENDLIVLPASARYIADKVDHSEQSYYAKTGHSPFQENPARFNQELAKFVLRINR